MIITQNECVGCGACVGSCPQKCIVLKRNEKGFYMPSIDEANCVSCKGCQRVCPANQRLQGESWEDGTYYAVWATSATERFEGSSGGMFGMLAERILSAGGVVFGAAYSNDLKSVVQTSTDLVSLADLKKSKYVESYTGSIFQEVKEALESERQVLYCGTACQIDGLKNYLKKDYGNLFLCDFLCQGVPASGLFEKYITNLESKYGKAKSVDFRSKAYGWKSYCSKVEFESGKTYLKTRFQDPYLRLFFENAVLREACYSCKRLNDSTADITLGDFWRVQDVKEIPDTNEGISLVGVHTPKGRDMMNEIIQSKQCYAKQLQKSAYQYAYTRSTSKPQRRAELLQQINEVDDVFSLPVTTKTRIKGWIYWLRAVEQKRAIKKLGGHEK